MAPTPDSSSARCHDDDLELARRCGRGDADAQRAFVDRFGALVYSVCAHSGLAGADRDDVSQQIMLDAFRGLPSYKGASRLATWIYSLALRRVSDHFRSPHRRELPLGAPGDDTFPDLPAPAQAPAPDAQAVLRREDRRVSRAMARLPPRERSVLLAYYVGEMSVAEISVAFGVPENTVKTRLHRGRLALRKELVGP